MLCDHLEGWDREGGRETQEGGGGVGGGGGEERKKGRKEGRKAKIQNEMEMGTSQEGNEKKKPWKPHN